MKLYAQLGVLLAVFFCTMAVAHAQIEITEIMYDLEGSDSGKEWIEVYNIGSAPIDLSTWRFFEADTNHKLSIVSGDGVLGSGEYAVIVADESPVTSADVLDSSFSLSNTGEFLAMRDADLVEHDSVTYISEWGAAGDGNSLQKIGGQWSAGSPTPGAKNSAPALDAPATDTGEGNNESSENEQNQQSTSENEGASSQTSVYIPSSFVPKDPEPHIYAHAGEKERVGIAGARVVFEGQTTTKDGKSIDFVRYIWNFGDGSRAEGQRVTHTYAYPGEYVVVLDVASGSYAAMDRVLVNVVPADIFISRVGEGGAYVEIENDTKYELDLSHWRLSTETGSFEFPKGTYMYPGKTIVLASNVTGLTIAESVSLEYPDGKVADTYDIKPAFNVKQAPTSVQQTSQTPVRNLSAATPVINNEAGGGIPPASLIKATEAEAEQEQEIKVMAEPTKILDGNVEQLALSGLATGGGDGLFWSMLGLALVLLIAIYAVLDRKSFSQSPGVKSEADLYKIIDIDDSK